MFWVGAKFHLRSVRRSLQRNIEPGGEAPAKPAPTLPIVLPKNYGEEVVRAAEESFRSTTRLGVEFASCRDRIKDAKQQQPGKKAADVGLPRELLTLLAERDSAEAEERVQSHPDRKEQQQTRVPKCRR
jgi:hypothetical protein